MLEAESHKLSVYFSGAGGLSLTTLLAAIFGALGIHLLATATYRIFFGPLRSLPGPWYTKVTDLWLTLTELAFCQVPYVDGLFAQYGPIIRLGPNTVAFMDANAAKLVYNKFPKSDWYKMANVNGVDVSFSMLESAEHSVRRRGFATHYTVENLLRFQSDIHDFALTLVAHLNGIAGRKAVDCLAMFQHMAVDVLGVSLYDIRIDATKQWCGGAAHELPTAVHDWPTWLVAQVTLPRWIWFLLHVTPKTRLQQFLKSNTILRGFAEGSISRTRTAFDEGRRDPQDQEHLVSRLIQYRMPDGKLLDHESLVCEMALNSSAAVDTVSTSAEFGIWALAKHPDVLRSLQTELDDVMPDGQLVPDATVLAALPYLNAVLKEVLRLYGAAPSLLPRVVPSTGQPLEIHGHPLPPGTIVATQAWSTHRQDRIYENPTTFKPERWLNETEAMKINYFPFGQGTRICAGQALALMILRTEFAVLMRNFNPVLPPHTTERSMEQRFSFVMSSREGKCDILFIPRDDA
ncbi:cytochrome P450 [Auriculariales sp. MPI-PUGE-AT-0066]|nr:cytochrome P450 [Auriculariales sp. MPI-PUGE-AT-0066]